MARDKVAGGHGAVETDAGAAGRAVGLDAAAVRLEVELRVLARDAALDRKALWLRDVCLHADSPETASIDSGRLCM